MSTFTKTSLSDLRATLQDALDQAGLEDMKITVGNCTYSGGEATFKVQCVMDGALTQEQQIAKLQGEYEGIDIDKPVTIRGELCTIDGYNSRARTYPWLVKRPSDGVRYKLSSSQVKMYQRFV